MRATKQHLTKLGRLNVDLRTSRLCSLLMQLAHQIDSIRSNVLPPFCSRVSERLHIEVSTGRHLSLCTLLQLCVGFVLSTTWPLLRSQAMPNKVFESCRFALPLSALRQASSIWGRSLLKSS